MAIAVANRYARALADVVSRTGDYRSVLAELESFLAAYRQSADLRDALDSPAVPLEKKIAILEAITGRMAVSKVATSFLRVLAGNYRLPLLGEICPAFLRLANDRLGVVQVKVMSATRLSEAEQAALRARFAQVTARKVEMEFNLDEDLLGGIVAQIQSTIYDGSVRGHLQRIREQLIKK